MISYVRGPLMDKSGDLIVVEAGQVGLGIRVPLSVLEVLPVVGEEVKLYTYLQVREDDLSLYGFLNRKDLEMFKQLITVNGIGPKVALGILSALRPDELRLAILTGDAKAITKAPGVGQKTAQRMILDLKDKVSAEDILSDVTGAKEPELITNRAAKEAIEALVALGYTNFEASKAVKQVEMIEDMDAERVLKASLKYLAFM
ncbi:MAG: Holliday junction branch migration protein RuvA [Clostridium sp.]